MRDVFIQIKYVNNIIHIESLTGNIVEGNIQIEGNIDFDQDVQESLDNWNKIIDQLLLYIFFNSIGCFVI